MVRPIVRDPFFLAQPSEPAASADLPVAVDLIDTLRAHADGCVGLAANMIGVRKRVIAVLLGPVPVAMLNPRILRRSDPYEAEEGCLSLDGARKARRWRRITLQYTDLNLRGQTASFEGFAAQIIQHELDHCQGVLI